MSAFYDNRIKDDNNQTVVHHTSKGCIEECEGYCKDDTVIVSNLPADVILTDIYVVSDNPMGEDIKLTLKVGLEETGGVVFEETFTIKDEAKRLDLDACKMHSPELVSFTIDELLPAKSKVCVMVSFINPARITGDIQHLELDFKTEQSTCNG